MLSGISWTGFNWFWLTWLSVHKKGFPGIAKLLRLSVCLDASGLVLLVFCCSRNNCEFNMKNEYRQDCYKKSFLPWSRWEGIITKVGFIISKIVKRLFPSIDWTLTLTSMTPSVWNIQEFLFFLILTLVRAIYNNVEAIESSPLCRMYLAPRTFSLTRQ